MFRSFLIVVLFCLLNWANAFAGDLEVVSKRYLVHLPGGESALLPIECSCDLSQGDSDVVRLILSIHSSNFDARYSFESIGLMLEQAGQPENENLVISPQFLKADHLKGKNQEGEILHWSVNPFWGSSKGICQGKEVSISAYEVVNQILEEICTTGKFPNLKTVIILGHSAGGQFVHRYSISELFEEKIAKANGVAVRYVVMAPSSYVYFDKQRVVDGSTGKFADPSGLDDSYNAWGYGLESLYQYHRKYDLTAEILSKRYPEKKVLFLVGNRDNNENDKSLANSPAAKIQGKHRYQRSIIYYKYLKYFFGEEISRNQSLKIIKGAGHSSRQLLLSKQAMRYIFAS